MATVPLPPYDLSRNPLPIGNPVPIVPTVPTVPTVTKPCYDASYYYWEPCRKIGSKRGTMTSPFLTALFRTVHATFAAHGSPGPVPLTRLRPRQGSASVHLAHLPWLSPGPCLPSPCAWLSQVPWWGVAPTSTMQAPSPSSSRKEGDPVVRHDETTVTRRQSTHPLCRPHWSVPTARKVEHVN
jgi:hypothetical protein